MVEGKDFVPAPPEKAEDQAQKPEDLGTQLRQEARQEAFQPRDVQRVGDTQAADKPKDPGQVYQTVFSELNAAKQGMLAVNEIIQKGGGPYAQGAGLEAYQKGLEQAQQRYTNARIAADTFLFVCDKQGNPLMDSTGNPIPSKENIALRQQLGGIEQNLQAMSQDKSPAGQQKMQQALEQSNQIKDLLRSSGYARANNAFALMFHSGDLQGQDRKNFAKTGVALMAMASKFDPAMMGPPPDANFMKHYDAAMEVVMGAGGGKPGDVQPPKPGDVQPPKPGDVQPPKPGDVQPPKPGDQAPKPGDQAEVPGAPGAKVGADGNQFVIDYRGLKVPTWTTQNPDGSPTKPFTMTRDVKQADGSVKQEQYVRNDGMLKPVTNAEGKVLGADGTPLMDAQGMRRIGDNGMPIPAQFDSSDPLVMQTQLDNAMKDKPLDDASRAAYNTVVESSDKLDRVAMARALEANEAFIKANPEAFQWESQYRTLNMQLNQTFNDLGKFRQNLKPEQVDALQKMWENVKTPQEIDTWLNKPENAAQKTALTQDAGTWAAIKSKYGDYLNKEAEIRAKEQELAQKPDLLDKVRKVRNADGMNQELARLVASPVDTRAGYMAKLLDQESVKKYMALADKNSPEAKALMADKNSAANIDEAKRVIVDLAKCNPQLAARLDATAKGLGVDLSKLATPAAPVEAPKPTDPGAKPGDVKPAPADPNAKPGDAKPADPNAKPGDAKPADPNAKPAETKPGDPNAPKSDLTPEQTQAPQVLNGSYMAFLNATEGATKQMKAEDFAKIQPAWEKALEANASIDPKVLDGYEKQAQDTYANQMALVVAMSKSGKTSFDQLVAADMEKVSKEDLQAAMTSAAQTWGKVNADLNNAVNALSPENKTKYMDAEKKFAAAMEKAQAEAGQDQAKLQAAYKTAFDAKVAEQKALNPDLAKAIDARVAFVAQPQGVFAKQFAENMQLIDTYKHVDEARIQLAQALNLQGGDANKAKATELIKKAMENPEAAKLLQGTQDGIKLLTELKLKTPDMGKLEDEQDKLFPELKLTRQAMEIMEKSKTVPAADTPAGKELRASLGLAENASDKDVQAAAWKQADTLFKQAEEAIEKEVMQKGQGKDVAESLNKMNATIDAMKTQLGMALDDFKNNRRQLPGPDGAGKDSDTKVVRDAMTKADKDHPTGLSQVEMVQALMGQKGPELQAYMQRALTDAEKSTLNSMAILSQKAQSVSLIRMQHALKASEFGFKVGDDSAKAQAKELVESIAKVDPVTFSQSPEVLGALKQAEQGRQMDVADGKAATIAFSEAAKDNITKTQTGIVDWIIPGASLTANTIGVKTTGHYISEVPLVGGLFGGSKEATNKLIDQLAMAQLSNAAEAEAQRNQTVGDGNKQLRGLVGDVTGVASSFGAGWAANKGLQYLAKEAPVPWYVKVPVVGIAALGTGGLVNNAVSGNDLLASKGFIRNTVATGTTYAAIKGLQYLPSNRTLAGETVAKLGLAEGTEITGAQLGKQMAAAEAAALGKGKLVQFAEALPSRLNPINYTPFRFAAPAEGASSWNFLARAQFAGWGGNRTASLLADGAMNLAEYNTRQFAAKTLSTFAIGYGFGALNKGAAIYTGEHLDGKKYDTLGAYWQDMNTAGLQAGIASSFIIPVVGKAMVPTSWQNGVGRGVNSLFTRIPGVDAAAATAATGSAALMFARPTMDASSRWGEASIYDNIYQQAQKRAAELRSNAAQQLQDQSKPQEQPKK